MNNFDDIILLPKEYKLLKKCNHRNGFFASEKQAHSLCLKNLITAQKPTNSNNLKGYCILRATDRGQRYIVWHKKHFVKSYYPIVISFVALGVSVIHIFLEILGII